METNRRVMKALVLEANAKVRYRSVPLPQMKDDECLVAIRKAGVCNSDISRAFDNGAKFYPLIMGHEMSGIVVDVGRKTKRIQRGDRVSVYPLLPCRSCAFCEKRDYFLCQSYDYYGSRRHGGFAEFLAVKEWNLMKLPTDISLEEAALLEPVAVGVHALKKIIPSPKGAIAILGAGLIGLTMAKQLTETINRKQIYLIDRSDFKLEIAKALKINTVNIRSRHGAMMLKTMKKAGIDCVIEACGAVETYRYSLDLVRSHGDLLWVGNIAGDLMLEKNTISSILRKELKIHGAWNSRFDGSRRDDWAAALNLIRRTQFLRKVISQSALSEGELVFHKMHLRRLGKIKKPLFFKKIFDISYEKI